MVLLHPWVKEKGLRLAEKENKLVFFVDLKADKRSIARAVEEYFNVKVVKVNTLITPKGKKKAIIQLAPEHNAFDIASKLGFV
ncbi:50S ribosomal protein L23 [Candidatus Woesearchaeota archaeon]|nr:50S ribosomal protein L23 [Candidatus Woesearchaeota archaeon]